MSSQNNNILDKGFEGLCVVMEGIEAIVDEYARCHPKVEPRVKTDDPSTFEESLCGSEEDHGRNRRRA
jgi:hypothetical protein